MTKITLGLPLSARQIVEFCPQLERDRLQHEEEVEKWQRRVAACREKGDDAGAAEPAPERKPAPETPAPVFKLRVPTLTQKLRWREELTAAGIRIVRDADLIAELRRGVEAIVIPDDRPLLLEVLDQVEAVDRKGEPRSDDLMAELQQIEGTLFGTWQPYDRMVAHKLKFEQWAGLIAAQLWLVGWDHLDQRFKQIGGKVPLDLLDQLPEDDVKMVADKALELLNVSRTQEKNSESPSRSASIPEISTTEAKPQTEAAGTSTASSTN